MPRCSVTGETFEISAREQEYCAQFDIPLPTIAPLPRMRMLASFRNRTYLFHGKCALTKRRILTSIAPERGLKAVDMDIYDSDKYNPEAFAREYDFSRAFFPQFESLLREVPLPSLSVIRSTMENSDFTNGITSAKNCYLIFSASFNEDCLYSKLLYKCRNVVGCVLAQNCELCYGCSGIVRCYNVQFSENCHDCNDSAFLVSCQSCKDCFGCVNLNQKQYYFFNEPLTKAEYEMRMAGISFASDEKLRSLQHDFHGFADQFPLRDKEGVRNEGSTGQHLTNTKNCVGCYSVTDGEDLESCIYVINAHSSMFWFGYGNGSRGIYNCSTIGDSAENVRFSFECYPNIHDLEYCAYLHRGSHNCFGCVGLRKGEYSILNKQYSRTDYFDMVKRIKAHMKSTGEYGKFFPMSCSPNFFNRSEGYDWMPLEKVDALAQGFEWLDGEPDEPGEAAQLPDGIEDCGDDLLLKSFSCELTGKKYKLQRAELEFHRRMNIALPRIAPLERIRRNAEFLHISPLRDSTCPACRTPIITARPVSGREILCERCFRERALES